MGKRCSKPVYRDKRMTYMIDSCAPQRHAIQAGKIGYHALTHGAYPGTPVPGNVLPGIGSIGTIDARGEQDWGFEPHRNEGIEIVFLETGHMTFIADGQRHQLRAGDLTITRPWQLHSMGDPNLGTGLLHWLIIDVGVRHPNQPWRWPSWVMLDPSDIKRLTTQLRLNENPVWKSTPDLRHAFREISCCVRQVRKPGAISRLTIHLNHLLLGLLEALQSQSRQDYPELITRERTVELFLSELGQTPDALSHPWTLGSMAEHCGMKMTSFAGHCRRLTNMSPIDYLNRCRLEWAANRLRGETTPITRIALECGFNTSQYFATRFQQKFKMSPRAYRNSQRGRTSSGSSRRKAGR